MLTTRIQDGIALLTIDLPGRSMNVMDWTLAAALDAEVARLAADETVIGLIITSGKGAFIAGADLAVLKEMTGTPREIAAQVAKMGDVFRRIETCGKPVVAAATGTALGAGLELMLACHYRIAADAKGAAFGLPEVKLGLFPGTGGTQRLPRIIGIEAALPLMLEGRSLSPAEALKAGVLHELVPVDDLIPAARRALKDGRVAPAAPWDRKGFSIPGGAPSSPRIMDIFSLLNARAQAATKHHYPAPPAILKSVFEGTRLPMDTALKLEQKLFGALFAGPEARAMIRTLFFARQATDKRARQEGTAALPFFSTEVPADAPRGRVIADEALAGALAEAGQPRAVPMAANGAFSLYATGCVEAFVHEGLALLAEGTSRTVIENCAIAAGMAAGPLALAGGLGIEGTATERPHGEASLSSPQEVKQRLLVIQAVAAAKALADGVAPDPAEADLGAVLGWGFPSYLGGPFGLMDREGLPAFIAEADRLAAAYGERFTPPRLLREIAAKGESFFPAPPALAAE